MKITHTAWKTIVFVALVVVCAACSENQVASPVSPTAVLDTAAIADVPATNVGDGISCPSDAPVVKVGGVGMRLDVEWTPIANVASYDVAIERYGVTNVWANVAGAQVTSTRLEWYGQPDSRYRVHVRSMRCGDGGLWSSWQYYSVEKTYGGGAPAGPTARLTNGSFENGFAGWTTQGDMFVVGTPFVVATDGTKVMDFGSNTTPNGVLSQTFATTPGQTYTLAFDFGAYSLVNTNTESVLVTVQGTALLLSQTASLAAPGGGTGVNWGSRSFTFVADSASSTLTFRDTSANAVSVDLLVDNVRVTP